MLISEGFQQKPIDLNQPGWSSDHVLQSCLRRLLPSDLFAALDSDMKDFQVRLLGPIAAAGRLADGPEAEPTLIQYDHFGQRVDLLRTSEGWRKLKEISHQEGLVAIPAERAQREYSRVFGFTKAYLMSPYGHYIGCPISMTDGCARVLELLGTPEMKRDVLPRLVSRDPAFAWTAGQWMTERPQGSDVSMTETTAKPVDPGSDPKPGDEYLLDGFKWFSSATDGNVALALARTGTTESGSKGLSLFLIKLRNEDGSLNGIQVHRLKKKFGTKALPTAELSLSNCKAQLIGQPGRGVANISTVLNITRVWSAMSGLSALRRVLVISKGFAQVRHVGGARGTLLIDNEMHTNSLLQSELVHRALCHFVFDTIHLLGRSEALESKSLSKQEKLRLRLLTPVVKSFSADIATKEMLGLMESLGGQGYMVENEIGTLLADGAVEKIWEGTTNTLSLDILRVLAQSKGEAMAAQLEWSRSILSTASSLSLSSEAKATLQRAARALESATRSLLASLSSYEPRILRPLLFVLGYYTSAVCLLEHAVWSSKHTADEADVDKAVFEQWVAFGDFADKLTMLERVLSVDAASASKERQMEKRIVYASLKL